MLTPGPHVERPADATHRIIYSIYIELEPLPKQPQDAYTALCVPLKGDGMPGGNPSCTNGRPRAPRRRTIDLRVADQILYMGRWHTIKSIVAYRDGWLTREQAERFAKWRGDVYSLPPHSSSLRATKSSL
jgi:hypothetical protein